MGYGYEHISNLLSQYISRGGSDFNFDSVRYYFIEKPKYLSSIFYQIKFYSKKDAGELFDHRQKDIGKIAMQMGLLDSRELDSEQIPFEQL